MVKALALMPEMNNGFTEKDGKPALVVPAHVNFGLAIDLQKDDGSRTLVVPSIKSAEEMDFVHFWTAYEDVVRKARGNKATVEDFQGTTISLTNPGGIGTVHSVPRLMKGQGAIIGVGALDYPAEWQGASNETLNKNAVSKILTLTSTYDHRIIQGAQSGDFLRVIHQPAPRRQPLLRRDLRVAPHPLRADPLGPGRRLLARRRHQQGRPRPGASSTPTACAVTSWPTPTRSSTSSVATTTSTSRRTA